MVNKWSHILEHKSGKSASFIKDVTMNRLEFKKKLYWNLHKEDASHQFVVLADKHERSPPR